MKLHNFIIFTFIALMLIAPVLADNTDQDKLNPLVRAYVNYQYDSRVSSLNDTNQSAPTGVNIQQYTIPVDVYDNDHIVGYVTDPNAADIQIEKHGAAISIEDHTQYKYLFNVAMNWSDIEPMVQYDNGNPYVVMEHTNADGVIDAEWNQSVNNIGGVVVFENLPFSTVTIKPLKSTFPNWSFETWTSYAAGKCPDSWANDSGTNHSRGMTRSTDAALGTYALQIVGAGAPYYNGWIYQNPNYAVTGTTIDFWIKRIGGTTGDLTVEAQDYTNGSRDVNCVTNVGDIPDSTWVHKTFFTPSWAISAGNAELDIFVEDSDATWLIDGVQWGANQTISTATETSDATHIWQNFSYNPGAVYTSSDIQTNLTSWDITDWTNISSITATIDGTSKTVSNKTKYVYVDTSGLTNAAHNVNITYNIVAASAPVASFTGTPLSGNAPVSVQFTDASTNTPTSWQWSWGDGTANGTSQSPSHTYNTAGTYTVVLTATNSVGSGGFSRSNYITVTGIPAASFTASPTSGAAPLSVTFTDTSTNTPTSWAWNFGDGTANSTSQNPTHSYTNVGTYTVTLTATNSYGSGGSVHSNYITTTQSGPTAAFTANVTSGVIPVCVQFTDQSTNSPTSWTWNFGDGSANSTSQNPVHTFSTVGNYTITLTVSNTGGSSTMAKTQYVNTTATAVDNVIRGVWCNDMVNTPSYWSTAAVDAGSGNASSVIVLVVGEAWAGGVCHFYFNGGSSAGYYDYAASDQLASYMSQYQADGRKVILQIEPGMTDVPTDIDKVLTQYSSAYSNTILGVDVDTEFKQTSTAYHVSDAERNTWINKIRGYNSTYKLFLTGYNDSSYYPSDNTSMCILFDGAGGNQSDILSTYTTLASHFSNVGLYTGYAITSDPRVASDAQIISAAANTKYIIHAEFDPGETPVPVASFTGTPLSGTCPYTVTFSDASYNGPNAWVWNFGDGSTSTVQNPTHTYTNVGNYTVQETATNTHGGSTNTKYTYVTVNTVSGVPTPSFTTSAGGISDEVIFVDTSTGSPTTWNWDFGDGGTDTVQNPYHVYNSPGTYTVTLTVTNAAGAASTTGSATAVSSGDAGISGNGYTNAYGAMMQMISCAENSQTMPMYNYAENINDGRGITFGLGFCTGTYDGHEMLNVYKTLNPNNVFVKYDAALTTIDNGPHNGAGGDGNPSVVGLTGFIQDVQNCNDPLFKQAELNYWNSECLNPAMTEYSTIGGTYNFTWAIMCDCVEREGADGMLSCANKATSTTGGTPKTGKVEKTWDQNFIAAYTAALKSENLGDTDRMVGWTTVLNSGNYALNTPYSFSMYGDSFTIDGNIGNLGTGVTAPVAAFTKSTATGTIPLTVQFTDTSSNTPTSWYWTFGDGGTSTTNNPSHTYTTAGTYTVQLTATNAGGSNSATQTITANQVGAPTASFTSSQTSGTVPFTVTFTDHSTGSPTSWAWNFGDGATSASQSPSHQYTTAGTYTVRLTATNSGGSTSSTATITASSGGGTGTPHASFNFNPTTGGAPLTVQFTDTSTGSEGSWAWEFGDGGTSTLQNPTHTYNTPGSYNLKLTVYANPATGTGSSIIVRGPVVVTAVAPPPTASFTQSTNSGMIPLAVQFTDTSTGGPTSWAWTFGDGATSTSQSPSHTYSNAGTYTITLTATNSAGHTASTSTVTASSTLIPTVSFTPSVTSGIVPLTVAFTDTSTYDAGTIMTNGDMEAGLPPSTSAVSGTMAQSTAYARSGTHSMSFISTSGTTDTYIVVENRALALARSTQYIWSVWVYSPVDVTIYPGAMYMQESGGNFRGIGAGAINGNPQPQTLPAGVWTKISGYGTTTPDWVQDTRISRVVLRPAGGTSSVWDTTHTIYYDDIEVSPIAWSWNFGDGTTSDVENPTHVFTTVGHYGVTVVATNPNGQGSASTTIDAIAGGGGGGTTAFGFTPQSGTAPLTVQFTDTSTLPHTSISWDFGDGNVISEIESTNENPTHTFTSSGTYNITMTLHTAGGGSSMASNSLTVSPALHSPTASFTGSPTSGTSPVTVTFTDASAGATSWYWDFGDGNVSSSQNPTNTYYNSGMYSVQLTATNTSGSNTLTRTGYISVYPTASFTGTPTSGTIPLTVQFTDHSTGSPTGYSWNFGDGTTSILTNPSHTYTSAGNYNVALTAHSSAGDNTSTRNSYISASGASSIHADFYSNIQMQKPNKPVQFMYNGTGTPATSWAWSFGDGTTSTVQNPIHTYTTTGSYNISLTASGYGVQTQVSKNAYIVVSNVISANYSGLLHILMPGNMSSMNMWDIPNNMMNVLGALMPIEWVWLFFFVVLIFIMWNRSETMRVPLTFLCTVGFVIARYLPDFFMHWYLVGLALGLVCAFLGFFL